MKSEKSDDRWDQVDEVLWVRLSARSPEPLVAPSNSTTYESRVENLSVKNDVWVELTHAITGSSCVEFENKAPTKSSPSFKLGRLNREKSVSELIRRTNDDVTITPCTISTTAVLGYHQLAIDKKGPTVDVDCHTPR